MENCPAKNINNEPCKFKQYSSSTVYCGYHKNKEYFEKLLITRANKNRDYYQNNKDIISDKHKIYYQKHKERLNEVYLCHCGCKISKNCMNRHTKSNKHKDLMEILNL